MNVRMKWVALLNCPIRRGGCSRGPGWWDTEASQHKSWDFLSYAFWSRHINFEKIITISCYSLVFRHSHLGLKDAHETRNFESDRDRQGQPDAGGTFVMHDCQKYNETDFTAFTMWRSILIVAQERKQSKMRTLGASNPHNNNKDKHRANTR